MKPEQAPIEIAKELHELNKKLDKLIDIFDYRSLIPAREGMTTEVHEPTLYAVSLDGTQDVLMTGNPEAHDYGVGYLGDSND